jgi:uncharacterized protein
MDIFGQKNNTDSPCIGICSTSIGDEVCVGCGRRSEEVIRWNTMTDLEKRQINQRLLKMRQKAQD